MLCLLAQKCFSTVQTLGHEKEDQFAASHGSCEFNPLQTLPEEPQTVIANPPAAFSFEEILAEFLIQLECNKYPRHIQNCLRRLLVGKLEVPDFHKANRILKNELEEYDFKAIKNTLIRAILIRNDRTKRRIQLCNLVEGSKVDAPASDEQQQISAVESEAVKKIDPLIVKYMN